MSDLDKLKCGNVVKLWKFENNKHTQKKNSKRLKSVAISIHELNHELNHELMISLWFIWINSGGIFD